ncbi:hypothetical protein LPJ57_007260, partial [Coemansia sp. RSA 486]
HRPGCRRKGRKQHADADSRRRRRSHVWSAGSCRVQCPGQRAVGKDRRWTRVAACLQPRYADAPFERV